MKYPDPALWMRMTQEQVFEAFCNITGSFHDGKGNRQFVYIPGTRKDRVLLVAHADTVWDDDMAENKIGFTHGIYFSENRGNGMSRRGIGADDRAGCCILWELQKLGHSLLVVSGEERGGITSSWMMRSPFWEEEASKHNFAVQFDRRGFNDIVFYSVGTRKFKDYVASKTGYIEQRGSFTDICNLCEDICGVNMSVGYYSEHTPNERLCLNQWINTLITAKAWLSQTDLPRFELVQEKLHTSQDAIEELERYYSGDWMHEAIGLRQAVEMEKKKAATISSTSILRETRFQELIRKVQIKCGKCNYMNNQERLVVKGFLCEKCKVSLI